jgi:hypothetical protein
VTGRHRAPTPILFCSLVPGPPRNVEHEAHWNADATGGVLVEGWCFGYYGPRYWAARERQQGGYSRRWERRRREELERKDRRRW